MNERLLRPFDGGSSKKKILHTVLSLHAFYPNLFCWNDFNRQTVIQPPLTPDHFYLNSSIANAGFFDGANHIAMRHCKTAKMSAASSKLLFKRCSQSSRKKHPQNALKWLCAAFRQEPGPKDQNF